MKIFGKHISIDVQPHQKGQPFLLGVHNWDGEMECCNEKVNVTEIGFGLIVIGICIQ